MKYIAKFELRLASAMDSVKEFENSINKYMQEFGRDEKLKVVSNFSMEIGSNRELSEEEQYKMKTVIEAQMVEKFPKYDVRLVSFNRQSGNVQQSVSQSVE